MNKNNFTVCRGIVVALKANFLIVEIDYQKHNAFQCAENIRLLCTRRSKLDYKGLFIDVGDIVFVEAIDYQNKRAVIFCVEPRKSFLKRPAVANVSLIAICISVKDPFFDSDQASRFLITAESANIKPLIILTKIDLIEKAELNLHINKLKTGLAFSGANNLLIYILSYHPFHRHLAGGASSPLPLLPYNIYLSDLFPVPF